MPPARVGAPGLADGARPRDAPIAPPLIGAQAAAQAAAAFDQLLGERAGGAEAVTLQAPPQQPEVQPLRLHQVLLDERRVHALRHRHPQLQLHELGAQARPLVQKLLL